MRIRISAVGLLCGWLGGKQALFLEGSNARGTDFNFDLFAVDNHSFGLKIWLPGFFGASKREGHIMSVLFAFAGNVTLLHSYKGRL